MKFIKRLIAITVLLFATQACADNFTDSRGVTVLNPPQPTHSGDKIEVLEFFFYGCSHCYKLHPFVSKWEEHMPKDVKFSYVPAIFNPAWEASARTYFALEAMGKREQVHDALFQAWHNGVELLDEDSTAKFLAQKGIDEAAFRSAYNSFSMQSQVMRAKQMGLVYGIRGTPTLVVNGKYVLSGVGPDELMKLLDQALERVRKETGKK